MLKKTMAFALVFAATLVSQAVTATTINLQPNGQWNTFDVDNAIALSGGMEWIDAQSALGYSNDGSSLDFKFTLTQSGYLDVVDGGFAGDVFKVFDNGLLLGPTSTAVNSYPASLGTNFDAAFADPNYSRQRFLFSAGMHDITGLLSVSALDATGQPINATVGALRLDLPEPATLLLFLVGGGVALAGRRRTTSN